MRNPSRPYTLIEQDYYNQNHQCICILINRHVSYAIQRFSRQATSKKPSLDKELLSNYHPIWNLSFLHKLLERVVLSRVKGYLTSNKLLNPNQSAYTKHHSTETLLTSLYNKLVMAIGHQHSTSLLFAIDEGHPGLLAHHRIFLFLDLQSHPLWKSASVCAAPAPWNGLSKDLRQFAHPPIPTLNFTPPPLALSSATFHSRLNTEHFELSYPVSTPATPHVLHNHRLQP